MSHDSISTWFPCIPVGWLGHWQLVNECDTSHCPPCVCGCHLFLCLSVSWSGRRWQPVDQCATIHVHLMSQILGSRQTSAHTVAGPMVRNRTETGWLESGFGTLGNLQLVLMRAEVKGKHNAADQASERVDRGPDPGSLRHVPAIRPDVDFSTCGPCGHRIAKRSRFSASGQLRSVELHWPGDSNPGQRNAQDAQHVGPGIGADPGCIPRTDVNYSHRHWATRSSWCAGSFGATGAVTPDRVLMVTLLVKETTRVRPTELFADPNGNATITMSEMMVPSPRTGRDISVPRLAGQHMCDGRTKDYCQAMGIVVQPIGSPHRYEFGTLFRGSSPAIWTRFLHSRLGSGTSRLGAVVETRGYR